MAENPATQDNKDLGLEVALLFHETYERLSPSFGYETRPDTRTFDPESPNGQLMIAVCCSIAEKYGIKTSR